MLIILKSPFIVCNLRCIEYAIEVMIEKYLSMVVFQEQL